MKTSKKTTWKQWVKRTFLVLSLLLIIWVVNLIWFKPLNIEHLYNRTFIKVMLKNPELITQLDVPVLYGFTKSELTDASDQADRDLLNLYKNEYETLQKYDFNELSEENQLNSKILGWYLDNLLERESFFYQGYSFDHLGGGVINFPRFMQEYHKLEKESDVTAYIKRLEKFPFKVNQLITKDSIRAVKGILPPDFIIKKTIGVISNLIGIPDDSMMLESDIKNNIFYLTLNNGLSKIDKIPNEEKSDLLAQTQTIIEKKIIPAYQDYLNHLRKLLEIATDDAGVWKLPNGDAYYRYCLKTQTTTTLDPETIHQIGLTEVDRIQKELREVVVKYGVLDSTIPMEDAINMVAYKTGNILYPSKSKDGKSLADQVLDFYRITLIEADSLFTPYFNIKPKSELVVRRTPEYLGSSQPNQYRYSKGQGIFFTNLTNIEKQDSIFLVWQKSLAYHEGIPGHHFQIAIQRELEDVPMFRNVLPFSAYTEGWGLYGEWLAYETGPYDNDPAGNLGRLSSELHRAVRLVVDTGIHYKRWSREKAIVYMMENYYVSREGSEREIDRYIVTPGQACAYKIGMLKILELRQKAEKELGENFDIRKFHDVILKNGELPLEVLDGLVKSYIEKEKLSVANNV